MSDEESGILKSLRNSLSDSGVNIATYSGASYIRLGNTSVRLAYREIYGEGAMKCALEIKVGDKDILYLGSGMLMSLTRDLAFELISRSDTVIFGAHGRKYEPSYELYLVFDNLESIFILGDGIFLSDNAARAYKENGTVIVTDRDAVISIKH
jgi:hypothetical protein